MTLARKARPAALKKIKEENHGLPLQMGLATLDKATRQKIAALGSAVVKESYDMSYYSAIGKKGGKAVLERYSVQYLAELGKKNKKITKEKKKEATGQ